MARGGYRVGSGAKAGNQNARKGFSKPCATCGRIFSLPPCYSNRVSRCSEECKAKWYAERSAAPRNLSPCRICGKRSRVKSPALCAYHYSEFRKTRLPGCRLCDRPSVSGGLCHSHFVRHSLPGSYLRKSYGLPPETPQPVIDLARLIYRAKRAIRERKDK